MSTGTRRVLARALVVAASLVLVLALIAGYVRRVAVDSDQFANRATVALQDDSVRALVAEKVTDDLVLAKQADLLAARPLIEAAVSGIVGGDAFGRLFRNSVRDAHRAVFARDQDTVTLTTADVGTVAAAALEQVRPSLARKLRATDRVEIVDRDIGSAGGRGVRLARDVRLLAALLLALAVLLVVAAVWVSPSRRHTAMELGIGSAAAGVVLVVALGVLRSLAVGHVDGADAEAAARAVWDAFLGDLRTSAWILAGSGAVVAACATSLIRPVDVREPLRWAGRLVTREPRRPARRVLRGLAILGLGVLVIAQRDAVVQLVVTVAGVFLIYEGVTAVLRVIPPAPEADALRAAARARLRRRVRHLLPAPVLAVGLVAAAIAIFLGSGGTTTAAPARGDCEGHAALCDRPLTAIALPATHNAMSVPLPGWYSAEQDRPIADQLADGIRGLLIDTHYADRLPNGKLRTDLDARVIEQPDGVSPDAVAAAERIRDRLGFSGEGTRGMYLCHTFCELGATTLSSVLSDIHTFLVTHPDEVLVVVNEDYVTPEDFVGAVRDAGLADLAFTPPSGSHWPTLGEMIDANKRVVFLAENKAGAAPWYQLVYGRLTQETPFTFGKVSLLTDPARLDGSCKANRGVATAPVFLINHWISTDPVPLPSHAERVNAYAPLLRRARTCQRLRKRLPNLLAVNFYRRGDLFRVVDTLNGV